MRVSGFGRDVLDWKGGICIDLGGWGGFGV